MFCAAIRERGKEMLFGIKRTAEDVNEAFELLKTKSI